MKILSVFLTILVMSLSSIAFAEDSSLPDPLFSTAEFQNLQSQDVDRYLNPFKAELANFKCGLKPLPPLGCKVGRCVCDQNGNNCQWVMDCGGRQLPDLERQAEADSQAI